MRCAAGAVVRREPLKGKGNVVRRAFADIDADIYLMIDGDDTYDAAAAPLMIEKLVDGTSTMSVGVREQETGAEAGTAPATRPATGCSTGVVGYSSARTSSDMLIGYRVFSRRFVKSFPAVSREFEIETELTVHSLACGYRGLGGGRLPRPRRRQRVQAAHLPRRLPHPGVDLRSCPARASCRVLRPVRLTEFGSSRWC